MTTLIPKYDQGSTGAVNRPINLKLEEVVSVKDFGAVGNGTTDDTVAIQNAINQVGNLGGGTIYFPTGTYLISAVLNVVPSGISFVGGSSYASVIKQETLNSGILHITGNYTNIQNLGFSYDGTPVAGGTAIYCYGSSCSFENFVVNNAYIGIDFDSGVANKCTNFELYSYVSIGLFAHNLNDLFVSKFIINANNKTNGALGGIRLAEKCEAFVCSDGDILNGLYSMTTAATVYGAGTRPAYNNFTNIFFDSSEQGVFLGDIVETEFVGCWFSNGRTTSGPAYSGCTIVTANSLNFTSCRFFNCGTNGCLVTVQATSTIFTACNFESNSVTSGPGNGHGLYIEPNEVNFVVQGCRAANGLYSGQQGYGIYIATGTSSAYSITNNLLIGNYTGSLFDGGTGSIKNISGNAGYLTRNSGAATITSGGTSVVVSHGLAKTPLPANILITPLVPTGSNPMFVNGGSVTSTTFTVSTNAAVSGDFSFSWQADIVGNG